MISFSFIYAMHRRLQQQQYGPQSPYSKSLRKGNATLHADSNEDDDEDLKSRPDNNEPSQKHDVPPTQHNRQSSDQKQQEVENKKARRVTHHLFRNWLSLNLDIEDRAGTNQSSNLADSDP